MWHLHEHPHSCRKVCSAGASPFPHTTVENRTVFLNQAHAWSAAEVQNMHKQTPLPPAWPWNKLEQHVYLNTPKQGRQRTATAWKPHSTFSTTLSTKLNSVYPAKLSTGTQLRDYSCTASFCPHQQQKSFRKAVSHHGGNLRRADILSCGSKGVLHTKQSTHNPWPFRTASVGWFPQEQIMYNL